MTFPTRFTNIPLQVHYVVLPPCFPLKFTSIHMFLLEQRRMKTLSQLLGRDGVAEGGRPGKGKRDTDAANDLWLRSRRSGKEEEEAAEAEPTFWLRARREGGHGFWLRARRGSEQEPGFWLRARKEDEPGFWLR